MKELIEFLEKRGLQKQADSLRNGGTKLDLRPSFFEVAFRANENAIGDAGARDLAAILKDNKSLTSLELGMNNIGEAGASSIAASLKDNKSLTSLSLDSNNIGDATLKIINEYLQRNKTIAEEKAESLNAEANDLCSQEKYNEAIEKYKAAIKIMKESLFKENKLYEENKVKAEKKYEEQQQQEVVAIKTPHEKLIEFLEKRGLTDKANGNPPQKQSTKGVEFSRNKEGDSINDNIKAQ